jgi:hypothetical protein
MNTKGLRRGWCKDNWEYVADCAAIVAGADQTSVPGGDAAAGAKGSGSSRRELGNRSDDLFSSRC